MHWAHVQCAKLTLIITALPGRPGFLCSSCEWDSEEQARWEPVCFHTEIMKTPRTPSRNSANMITEIKGIATEARPDKQVCAVPQGYKRLSPSPIFMILYPNFIKLYKICTKYKYTFWAFRNLLENQLREKSRLSGTTLPDRQESLNGLGACLCTRRPEPDSRRREPLFRFVLWHRHSMVCTMHENTHTP